MLDQDKYIISHGLHGDAWSGKYYEEKNNETITEIERLRRDVISDTDARSNAIGSDGGRIPVVSL